MPIPITVFTGFLGAGKTTLILSLLPQLPKHYKAVLLKNEFGDVEGANCYLVRLSSRNADLLVVDSQLAKQSSLTAVSEILNGCMCCVLVGQMKNALLEIREQYKPDRIIIECSGSAFPATLAFQLRELERETEGDLKMDAIVTVIDAENFIGYEDTSPTAKMQASYTDVILINKWENVSERNLDIVLDHLHTLNDLTPKIRVSKEKGVDPSLIFGLDTKLFSRLEDETKSKGGWHGNHNDEVQTVTVHRGRSDLHSDHGVECGCSHDGLAHIDMKHQTNGVDTGAIEEERLIEALNSLPKESIWRVKGFIRLLPSGDTRILNWAFGRYEFTAYKTDDDNSPSINLTIMGQRGEMKRLVSKFAIKLGAELSV